VEQIELKIAVETDAMSVQRSLVLGGHGLTILPAIAAGDDAALKPLTAAPLCQPKITRSIVLALPANRAVTRPIRCAVEVLVQCVKEAVQHGAWREGRWLGP
jgi:LysR family nitrogen assimilation transcriptional regulator